MVSKDSCTARSVAKAFQDTKSHIGWGSAGRLKAQGLLRGLYRLDFFAEHMWACCIQTTSEDPSRIVCRASLMEASKAIDLEGTDKLIATSGKSR